jgi:hypothetical protein
MKMVKRLLLGSAAGLVAVSAGQAADLPVKAKPVEYVKICSLYGAGFYYMPGTDMCIKIGGYMRAEASWGNNNGSLTNGPFTGQADNRDTNNFVTRSRFYITADVRDQTAYGTARAYVAIGIADNQLGFGIGYNNISANRAFIQWAGITAGITQSFYDFYNNAATAYRTYWFSSDTGDGGQWLWGYTWQLGNGMSASISAEDRRMTQIIGARSTFTAEGSTATAPEPVGEFDLATNAIIGASNGCGTGVCSGGALINPASLQGLGYGGYQSPDIVANVRIDQTWGSAQIMGAAHELNPEYFDPNFNGGVGTGAGTPFGGGGRATGHPSDTWGWAVGAGLRLNFPMIAQGDYLQTQVNYTQGALRYMWGGPTPNNFLRETSNNATFGILSDCVFFSGNGNANSGTPTSGCEKTTGWNVNAAYEHYWTPAIHQSLVGQYGQIKYDSQANNILCGLEGGAITQIHDTDTFQNQQAFFNNAGVPTAKAGCSNNWNLWGVSSRLQWDITKSFYLGVELVYEHMESASSADGRFPQGISLGNTSPANQFVSVGSNAQNVWVGTVRMHKDFLP